VGLADAFAGLKKLQVGGKDVDLQMGLKRAEEGVPVEDEWTVVSFQ